MLLGYGSPFLGIKLSGQAVWDMRLLAPSSRGAHIGSSDSPAPLEVPAS